MKALLRSIIRAVSPKLDRWILLNNFKKTTLPVEFVSHMNQLTKDHVVLDLGANVGLVSECMAKKGAKVISFEPNRNAYIALEKVASSYENITTHHVAVGTQNQTVKLYLHMDSGESDEDLTQASSLLAEKPNVSTDLYYEVQEIDFAEFLKSHNHPIELIKVDIEGYEIQLINHLLDEDALGNVKKIYVETHERKFKELAKPTEKLKRRINAEGLEDKFFYDWH